MKDERSQRTAEAIAQCGADWAILTSPEAVAYATDFDGTAEGGLPAFAGGPTVAIVDLDGNAALLVVNYLHALAATARANRVESYEGFTFDREGAAGVNYVEAVDRLCDAIHLHGKVAVEPRSFPRSLAEALTGRVTAFIDLTPALTRARATKTDLELKRLAHCAALTGIGQTKAVQASTAGRSEIDVFSEVRAALERAHGARMVLGCDYQSGATRTASFGEWPASREIATAPTARVVQAGDPIICDLAPHANGYWGDSCNSMFVGEPTPAYRRMYRVVFEALNHGLEILRPGITAGEVDRGIRGVVRRAGFHYPHHTGHGVGAAAHESPRLVDASMVNLEADMVLAVEPAAYDPAVGGVRLELMVRLTPAGNEVMSPFRHSPSPG